MAWTAQQATDLFNYNIYLQDKDNSCACACVTMVARLVKSKILDEATVRSWVQKAEGGTHTDYLGIREFDRTPTARDLYGSIFKNLGISSFPVKGMDNVAKWITKVSRAHPAVMSLGWQVWNAGLGAWERSGGHAVLAVNVHGGNVIFLDPGIGVVEIPVASLPVYAVTYAGAANASQAYMEEMRTT
jgi:hypothetical protein